MASKVKVVVSTDDRVDAFVTIEGEAQMTTSALDDDVVWPTVADRTIARLERVLIDTTSEVKVHVRLTVEELQTERIRLSAVE